MSDFLTEAAEPAGERASAVTVDLVVAIKVAPGRHYLLEVGGAAGFDGDGRVMLPTLVGRVVERAPKHALRFNATRLRRRALADTPAGQPDTTKRAVVIEKA